MDPEFAGEDLLPLLFCEELSGMRVIFLIGSGDNKYRLASSLVRRINFRNTRASLQDRVITGTEPASCLVLDG